MSPAQHRFRDILRQSMPTVEGSVHIGTQVTRGILQGKTVEVLGAGHRERQAKTMRKPASKTHVIGVKVSDNHRYEALPHHWSIQHRVPCLAAIISTKSGVEDCPAIVAFEEIYVDMIESIRQRQAEPLYTPGDLNETAVLRRLFMRNFQVSKGRILLHHRNVAGMYCLREGGAIAASRV